MRKLASFRSWVATGPLLTLLVASAFVRADTFSGLGDDTSGPDTELGSGDYSSTSKAGRFAGNPGSAQLDNGMVIKWGTISITWGIGGGVESGTRTYVPAFDAEMLTLNATVENASGAAVEDISVELTTVPATQKTQFAYDVECFTCVLGGSATIRWQATGY